MESITKSKSKDVVGIMMNDLVKLKKEEVNELLRYISMDNHRNGLILKLVYVYARSIGDILKLQKKDIDVKHNAIDFIVHDVSVSFMLHDEVKSDLINLRNSLDNDEDFLFLEQGYDISKGTNVQSNALNMYLYNFIKDLNTNKLSWHCPILVCTDFKVLRGQHLFLDGASLQVINELYVNRNIISTKDMLKYNELLKLRFPITNLDKVFHEHTDLGVYTDKKFLETDLFTVCKDNNSVILEYDYLDNVLNVLGDNEEIIGALKELDKIVLDNDLHDLETGNYRFVNGLRIIKN